MIHFLYNFYLTQEKKQKYSFLFKKIFWTNYKILKLWLPKYYKNLSACKLNVDPKSDIIVSLTSFPERINIVYLTIKSILFQTKSPQKVILWLAIDQFPNKESDLPLELLDLKRNGLEICFCDEDIKPHKKYFYSFKLFKEYRIITIDDDVIYSKLTIELLDKNSLKYPNAIIANRVRTVSMKEGALEPYRRWKINENIKEPAHKLFATGVGGVLYKSNFFDESLYNHEIIKKICINADDIWLKGGSLKNNVPVFFTNYFVYPFIEIPDSQKESLFSQNVFNNTNDKQIQEVFDFFNLDMRNFE